MLRSVAEVFITQPIQIINIIFFLGTVGIILTPKNSIELIRRRALYLSLVVFGLGVLSCLAFNQSMVGFQYLGTVENIFPLNNLSFAFGVDGLSMIFLLLTLFVFPICFAAAGSVTQEARKFYIYLLVMEGLLIVTFTTLDLFFFYVFFESLLIPMFILIGVWGARERKIKAAYLFFLYTLFGSLIMLFGVLYLYLIIGSTNYFVLLNTALEPEQQKLIGFCFFMAFAVKMPLFPFHIGLPEAHVEAPTVGSMLLASLLLKLGGYGFLRFSLPMLSAGSAYFSGLVSTLALLGVIYGSLATIRQIDLKRIIAYSSVAHMNLVMLGLFSNSQQGIEGAIYLMVGHGVVSTALFFCVGVLYDRYHSRLLRYYGGVVTVMPIFAFFLFAFTLANMSFPGTSNFLGELLLFLGVYANNSFVLLFATAGIVLSAVYSVGLYNRVVFGTLKTTYINRFTEANRRETTILAVLLMAMIIVGITADFILNFTHFPIKAINYEVVSVVLLLIYWRKFYENVTGAFSRVTQIYASTLFITFIVTIVLVTSAYVAYLWSLPLFESDKWGLLEYVIKHNDPDCPLINQLNYRRIFDSYLDSGRIDDPKTYTELKQGMDEHVYSKLSELKSHKLHEVTIKNVALFVVAVIALFYFGMWIA